MSKKELLEKIRETRSTLIEFQDKKSESHKALNYNIVLLVLQEFSDALIYLLKESEDDKS